MRPTQDRRVLRGPAAKRAYAAFASCACRSTSHFSKPAQKFHVHTAMATRPMAKASRPTRMATMAATGAFIAHVSTEDIRSPEELRSTVRAGTELVRYAAAAGVSDRQNADARAGRR